MTDSNGPAGKIPRRSRSPSGQLYARRRTAYAGGRSERRLSQKGHFRDTPRLRRGGQVMIDGRENEEEREADAEAPVDQLFLDGQQRPAQLPWDKWTSTIK